MGLYSKLVFPCLCDFMLDRPFVARYRRAQLAEVGGDILEIGVGTGLNLPNYPPHVQRITAIDPNPGVLRRLRMRIRQTGVQVDQQSARSENLPFADLSFDYVVSSLTLCSIAHVELALREIHRVLKKGGRFLFLEHGLNPNPKIQKWQRRLNPLQRFIGDGCRLDLDVRQLVNTPPFSSVAIENFQLERTPRTHGYMYSGVATK